jgi:hypothetical protein
MINWKELEKFIAPGKVMTLVILIDGKEVGALSFNVDSLAYKAALESKPVEPVKIADKKVVSSEIKKAETERKESLQAKKTVVDKNDKTKKHPEFNPVPATAEKIESEETDDDDNYEPEVDEETGEVKEDDDKEVNLPKVEPVPEKRLTRAEIMAQSESAEVRANEHSGSKSAEHVDENPRTEQAPADQTFGEEW